DVGHPHLLSFPTRRSSDLLAAPELLPDPGVVIDAADDRRLAAQHRAGRQQALHRTTRSRRLELARMAYMQHDRQMTTMLHISHRSEEHTSELQSRENLVCR